MNALVNAITAADSVVWVDRGWDEGVIEHPVDLADFRHLISNCSVDWVQEESMALAYMPLEIIELRKDGFVSGTLAQFPEGTWLVRGVYRAEFSVIADDLETLVRDSVR